MIALELVEFRDGKNLLYVLDVYKGDVRFCTVLHATNKADAQKAVDAIALVLGDTCDELIGK